MTTMKKTTGTQVRDEATWIAENQYGVELRFSDGSHVWPGYADNMRLSRGYWFGCHRSHYTIESVDTLAQAVAYFRENFAIDC